MFLFTNPDPNFVEYPVEVPEIPEFKRLKIGDSESDDDSGRS